MANMSTYFTIADSDGNQITTGIAPHLVARLAQRMADERGEAVNYSSSEDEEDAKPIEVKPSSIEVVLDTPNGPLVRYGGHDAEAVEREIPEGYEVDWSSAVEVSVSGTHLMRYSAPLVQAQDE